MLRLRTFALALILATPALGPALAGGGAACAAAASGRPHAALVVDTGARTTTYCVALDASAVSGIRLIQLAASQYGLSYHLGFGSAAVCQLNGVGPGGGDCFADYPEYWGYWHGTAGGGWTWAGSGAASASVGDGDVDGWSWGTGDSGTTHAPPPSQRFSDVCDVTSPSPAPSPEPSPDPSPKPTAAPPSSSPSAAVAGGSSHASGNGSGGGSHASPGSKATGSAAPTPSGSTSPEIVRAVAAGGETPVGGAPPVGAIVVAVAVLALGIGGALTLRRRRRPERP